MEHQPLLKNINSSSSTSSEYYDPMKKYKKSLWLSDPMQSFLLFVFYVTVIIPIWFSLLLPISICSMLFEWLMRMIFPKHKKADVPIEPSVSYSKSSANKPKDIKYDLVIFGATGFTGKLAADYVAKTYGSKQFRWAIAGRRRDALEDLRRQLQKYDNSLKDLPIIIADSSNYASLIDMVNSTKVIIATVGPFDKCK